MIADTERQLYISSPASFLFFSPCQMENLIFGFQECQHLHFKGKVSRRQMLVIQSDSRHFAKIWGHLTSPWTDARLGGVEGSKSGELCVYFFLSKITDEWWPQLVNDWRVLVLYNKIKSWGKGWQTLHTPHLFSHLDMATGQHQRDFRPSLVTMTILRRQRSGINIDHHFDFLLSEMVLFKLLCRTY